MKKRYSLGRIAGIELTAEPTTIVGATALTGLIALFGRKRLALPWGLAIPAGALGALLHFASELWHQLGHARAARQAGFPMRGVHFWWLLGTSLYPKDEGVVPDEVHIARALGGPAASALLTTMAAALAVLLRPFGGVAALVAGFFALDNLLVFTLGAFLPLKSLETDGVILLRYLRRERQAGVIIQE